MNNFVCKFICLFTMCSLTLSVSAQVESVRGPQKRATTTTTTTVRQNQSTVQQRQSSGTNTQQRPSSNYSSTQQRAETRPAVSAISTSQRVDLGLSVYWAGYNVGASSPEENGSYFAWGETSPKSSYNEENSATLNKKFQWLQSNRYIDSRNNLTLAYDAARANWGGSWRMPTRAEFEELKNKCKWEWTTYGGKKGYKVTGPNGNAIFLPASGWRIRTSLNQTDEDGRYWSSTPLANDTDYSLFLYYKAAEQDVSIDNRYHGYTVRAVSAK